MKNGDAQLRQVGDPSPQPLQGTGEEVGVGHGPHHPIRLVPVGIGLAEAVQGLEFGRPLQPHLGGRRQHALQVVEEVVILAVERVEVSEKPGKVGSYPGQVGGPLRRLGLFRELGLQPG